MKNLKFKVTFKEPGYSVPVSQMRPGQVGVITRYRHEENAHWAGRVVCWGHKNPDAVDQPVVLMDLTPTTGPFYGAHVLGGPDLGTRVRILADGDQLVAGKDGALTVKWAEKPAKDPTIPVRELEPGQAGVVTGWSSGHEAYNGLVVARSPHWAKEDRINVLGDDNGWKPVPQDDDCRVRPIGPGDVLEAYEAE